MKKLTIEEITAQRISTQKILRNRRFPILALLDNVRSLHNVGSIFRTADAVRAEKLFLTGITGYPPRKEIDKTALGATQSVPWEYQKDPLRVINTLKEDGTKIAVLEHTSESNLFNQVKFQFPLCLVVGNEVEGIRDDVLSFADFAVDIPMYGVKQSLNVTIAFGIVIYEIMFQYLKNHQLEG